VSRRPPPPPPSGADRRRHPRIELIASVEIARGDEVFVMTATNVSMGGVFLEGAPEEHPELARGVEVSLTLAVAGREDRGGPGRAPPPPQVVRARGKIVRVQQGAPGSPAGFGVVLTQIGADDVARLRTLVGSG
jgi:hypothetical protein